MFTDIIYNGRAYGEVAQYMSERRLDPGVRRPYLDKYGRPCVTINTGRWTVERGQRVPLRESRLIRDLMNNGFVDPIFLTANASALRKEQWIELDRAIIRAARPRMRAWADLMAANSFGGFNGMAKMTLEYETMSDPGVAVVDMDAMTEGRHDAPLFSLRSLPLPITHSDFWFSERRLAISRNGDTPLDTTMGEAAGRRIAESIERTTIGVTTGVRYGDVSAGPTAHDTLNIGNGALASQVYGYLNFPHRIVKDDMTAPTAGGWNPTDLVSEFLACRELLYQNNYFGPYMVYHSTDWDQYLDNDYYFVETSGAGNLTPSRTLRSRLREIEGITDIRRLDFLTATDNPFTFVFVQMTSDVARAVNGMEITTVQWPAIGGMRTNFKVMAIQVPQLRSDFTGATGILQATTS